MEKWFLTMKKADFNSIARKYHISPITARLIRNRDVIGDEAIDFYLNGTIADLYDGMLMQDMDKAVEILAEKIGEEKQIRIIGDYDIDGVNATYILQEGLSGLGAHVDTDIPDRIKDGYGLNIDLINRALDDGVDTIITCDNGIAAADEIAYREEERADRDRDGSPRGPLCGDERGERVPSPHGRCGGGSAPGGLRISLQRALRRCGRL